MVTRAKQSLLGRASDSLRSLTWCSHPHDISGSGALERALPKSRDLLPIVGVLVALLLLSQILSACHLRPLLYDVSVSPKVISPNADGTDDVTNKVASAVSSVTRFQSSGVQSLSDESRS